MLTTAASAIRDTEPVVAKTQSPCALLTGLVVVTWALGLPSTPFGGPASAAEGLPVLPPTRQDPVRFQDEILPILAANCTACHNPKTHEGGLVLDTLPAILKGGDAGPAAVAGKPAESVLFLRATHRQDDPMPPADNTVGAKSLSPAQLGLLERWIAEGAQSGPAPTRQPIAFKPLPPGTGAVVATAMTRDGRITAAARGSRVSLFDTLSGRLLGTLLDPTIPSSGGAADVAHRDVVSAVEFAPGGDLVATGSFRTVRLWRRRSPQRVAEVAGSAGAVAAVAAAAGTQAAVGLPDGKILICDAATGTVAHTLAAHAAAVSGLAFGSDGTLLSAARDGSVVATRIADGAVVGKLARPGEVRAVAIVDSNRLATAEADNAIRIWTLPLPAPDAAAPTPLKELSGIGQPTAAMCDVPTLAGHLISGSADGVVRLWSLESGSVVRQFAHGGAVAAVAARPDGSRLASAGTVPGVKVWETATGKLVAEPKGDPRIADRQRYAEYDVAVGKQDVDHGKAQFAAAEKAVQAAADETKKAAEKLEAAKKGQTEKAEALAKATAARTEADKVAAAAAAAMAPAMEAVAAATKAGEAAKAAAEAAAATATAFEKAAAGDQAAAEGLKNVQAAAAAALAAKTAAEQAVVQANQQVERAKARMADTAKKAEETVKPQEAAAEAKKQADMAVGTAERGIEFAKQQTQRADADLPLRKQEADKSGERLTALEAAQKQVVADATGAEKPVVAVRFTRDGNRLACLVADGRLLFVDPGDGLSRQCFDVAAGAAPPTFLAVADGDALVVAGGGPQAAVWAAADGWTLDRTIGG
ncbi:MAG: WD40 repeat domain-containing protein [Planctomycetia bacterium]